MLRSPLGHILCFGAVAAAAGGATWFVWVPALVLAFVLELIVSSVENAPPAAQRGEDVQV